MADDDNLPARPAVEERGELTLELGGASMSLRPSYEAIVGFEAATGKGLLQLAREALNGRLTLAETAQVACECVRAWGREAGDQNAAGSNAKKVAKLILEAEGGLHATLQTVSAMLSLAVTGGYDASGEAKPSAMTTTAKAPVDG